MNQLPNGLVLAQMTGLEALQVKLEQLEKLQRFIETLEAIEKDAVTDIHRKNFQQVFDECKDLSLLIFCDNDPVTFKRARG